MSTELPVWAEAVRARLARLAGPPPRELAGTRPVELRPSPMLDQHVAPGAADPSDAELDDEPGRFRWDPGRRGVKALAAVVVVIALVVAAAAWASRPRPATTPVVRAVGIGGSPSAEPSLVIAVAGKVHHPGLVRVRPGARVADVLDAAGGALPDADLGQVNLARKVADGELIVFGVPIQPAGADPNSQGKVNLNSATLAELDALPGVGPVTAQRIIDYRTKHGQFAATTQLRQVDGIGAARFEQLKDLVTV